MLRGKTGRNKIHSVSTLTASCILQTLAETARTLHQWSTDQPCMRSAVTGITTYAVLAPYYRKPLRAPVAPLEDVDPRSLLVDRCAARTLISVSQQ